MTKLDRNWNKQRPVQNHIQCGRCGKWVRVENSHILWKTVSFGEIKIFRTRPREQTGKVFLCPECVHKFAHWMRRGAYQ